MGINGMKKMVKRSTMAHATDKYIKLNEFEIFSIKLIALLIMTSTSSILFGLFIWDFVL